MEYITREEIATKLRKALDTLNESPADVDESMFWWVIGEVEDVLKQLEANNESV